MTLPCCLWNALILYSEPVQMSSPKYHICALLELRGAHLDAGAHGGGDDAGLNILALGGGGLGLDDGAHDRVEVLGELLGTEG